MVKVYYFEEVIGIKIYVACAYNNYLIECQRVKHKSK